MMQVLIEFLLAFGHLSSTLKLGFEVIRECVDTNQPNRISAVSQRLSLRISIFGQ